jgi:hypothetical protein
MSELYPDTVLENLSENDCFGTAKRQKSLKSLLKTIIIKII